MIADNKHFYLIWKKLKHINNVTPISYGIFIRNLFSFLKI